AKFGYEFQSFVRSCADFSTHLSRNTDHDFLDFSLSNDLCNPLSGVFVRRNRFKRVSQQTQFVRNRQPDSRSTEIDPQNWIHLRGRETIAAPAATCPRDF